MIFSKFEFLFSQLLKFSPVSQQNLSYLKPHLTDLANRLINTTVYSNGFLWQKNHFEVAKCLNRNSDILITRPDKGASIGILNRTDYITKIGPILDDTTKFLKIGDLSFDDTYKLEIKLQKRFLELFKKKFFSWEVCELIHPIGLQRPQMYGLPKIYKSDIPLRPILSMCHSIQHSLAKWLIQGFCVDDSFTFSSMIRLLLPCVVFQFMVSFDIPSLFTNVPLNEVIFICADFLYWNPLISVPSFPESVFMELMELATKSVSFSFNDTIYRQADSILMGSPWVLILVRVFVHITKLCHSSNCWMIYTLL